MKNTLNIDSLPSKVQTAIRSVTRTAYIPETTDEPAGLLDSRFCGQPALEKGESHPACGCCERPMPLLLQLNKKDLPDSAIDLNGGILQLFYCLECSDYEPFSKSHLVRIANLNEENAVFSTEEVDSDIDLIEKRITGFTSSDDYPMWEEREKLNMGIAAKHLEDIEDENEEVLTLCGEKLGGWPYWVQGVEYPNCPHCDTTMSHLFQIDSERNISIMFGDMGVGHITQCPQHKDTLAFTWACG